MVERAEIVIEIIFFFLLGLDPFFDVCVTD